MRESDPANPILHAKHSARFRRAFVWYSHRLLRKRFAAVRLATGSTETLRGVNEHEGPAIIVMNHPSWWDPILALVVGHRFFSTRPPTGPIDAAQWRKFGFMKRLGLFGLDPDHHNAINAMTEHVLALFQNSPRTVLGITPQGMFTDVRDTIRPRPGVAAIAARSHDNPGTPGAVVASLTMEYAFWNEPKPEVFLRAQQVDAPATPTTPAWHRAIRNAMAQNAEKLAELVLGRDPANFDPLIGTGGTSVHPVYDRWLRLRGHDPQIQPRPETRP